MTDNDERERGDTAQTQRVKGSPSGAEIAAELDRSADLETIRSLAGGVAHNMNNILGVITGIASTLLEEVDDRDSRRSDIQNILAAARRGKTLTQNLIGFAGKGKYVREQLSVADVVLEARKLLAHVIPNDVELEIDLDQAPLPVTGDFNQLVQLCVNLCLNSIDALRGGRGTLTISTTRAYLGPEALTRYPRIAPGVFVVLKVKDTGMGMTAQVLSNAFEPFFTTKSEREGTGLGLSMVSGVVSHHGGVIEIESEPGRGTTVTVYLPRSAKGRTTHDRCGVSEVAERRGVGMVLVVDDEPLACKSAGRTLAKRGFDIVKAYSGFEAIDVLARFGPQIVLVLLDLIMPGMGGEETFEELRRLDPEVPVLLVSGFYNEDKVNKLLQSGAAGFIEKPYDVDAFLSAVFAAARAHKG